MELRINVNDFYYFDAYKISCHCDAGSNLYDSADYQAMQNDC
jgi:hypothetical protein